jgi:hypothetical protein
MPEVNCTCDAADWVPPALHSEFCEMRVPSVPVSRVPGLSLTAEVQDAISHLLAVHDIAATPQDPNFYPSDVPKLTPDQKGVLDFAVTMMNSGYPRELLRSWVDAPTSQEEPRSEHDKPCKLPPHEVCENSRDCIKCGERIAPSYGVCFTCAQASAAPPQDHPRQFTDEQIEALKATLCDFECGNHPCVVIRAMLAESSESVNP